jgi:hypothetical protein
MILKSTELEAIKTQMGTTISDSSHFTAFNRSFLHCQVTVILPGSLSLSFRLASF